ncbi:MAG: 16S rRNA (uracil(1498)-N(3))-methyltransferase [Candidatus Dadabacteria bacterium]|nr:16S rRNA (uracil(1498)-N(3))-methyltransferase [Candidatus Dadabacteria bacterium]MYA48270.1 16S rRNA (uracil(1498)-N(3))-methyltransferase [Candidatus Dadabacteria bacterium]MYF48013.1 16S rRNA (uracil(1498)-N(3))-methyltransferase [Candidatus Dadabacteria bacterium]MYG82230.1 16S rRNA (uracil(1498)-N(3))-methyltransferase [Candidatus Dadabacteria bacterium]MYK49847.1 16S rRNA (uracil(1498)-N(3))-methyltransferase [Candidatus Dadabacteria bacterium]
MPRFPIIKKLFSEDDKILRGTISESDYTHITKVLRLGAGNRITVFDTESIEYEGVIMDISSGTIAVQVDNTLRLQTESELELNLFQAILKGNRMDTVISQATQLGVSGIFPLISERTQVRSTAKVDRWNKIARESTKQCGRTVPPAVSEPVDLQRSLEIRNESEMKIILYENQNELLRDYMSSHEKSVRTINLFIGPEGGFSEQEITLAEEKGYTVLGLGERILRAETASVVSLALLQSRYGDI